MVNQPHREMSFWSVYDINGKFIGLSNKMMVTVKKCKINYPNGFRMQRYEENGKKLNVYVYLHERSPYPRKGYPESFEWRRIHKTEVIE